MEDRDILRQLLNGNHLEPLEVEQGFIILEKLRITLNGY